MLTVGTVTAIVLRHLAAEIAHCGNHTATISVVIIGIQQIRLAVINIADGNFQLRHTISEQMRPVLTFFTLAVYMRTPAHIHISNIAQIIPIA